jgi:predicted DsbA family dithiol-disulfide isomerase
MESETKEKLFKDYFTDRKDMSDHQVLEKIKKRLNWDLFPI